MRATARDVLRHPTWLSDWWLDTPYRHPRNWRVLLLTEGRGWLRWSSVLTERWVGSWHPPETYWTAPPLRRLWGRLRFGQWVWPRDDEWPHGFLLGGA